MMILIIGLHRMERNESTPARVDSIPRAVVVAMMSDYINGLLGQTPIYFIEMGKSGKFETGFRWLLSHRYLCWNGLVFSRTPDETVTARATVDRGTGRVRRSTPQTLDL